MRVAATPTARADDSKTPAARAPQIRQIEVRGHSLRVAVWPGDSRRVPLLLFNGIGGRLELLAPFAEALDGFEVIAFDVPGTGESAALRHPYRLWMLSRLVSHMLDALGYDRVDVLGVSWGGALAQQFALQNPKRCRRLILAAAAQGMLMVPGKLSVLKNFATPRRYNDPAFRDRIMGEIYGGKARKTHGPTRKRIATMVQPTGKRGYLMQQLAIAGWTSVPWLPLVRQRTLVMAGDDDPIIPLINAKLMVRLLPRAELHVFNDGHMFLLSSVAEASGAVRDFLDAEEAPRSRANRGTPICRAWRAAMNAGPPKEAMR